MPLVGRDPLNTFTTWAQEYSDIFHYRAAWIHVYFLNRPELIEFVLVRNHANLLNDRVVQNSRWFFGNGLLTSEVEEWKRQHRRDLNPAGHRVNGQTTGAILSLVSSIAQTGLLSGLKSSSSHLSVVPFQLEVQQFMMEE